MVIIICIVTAAVILAVGLMFYLPNGARSIRLHAAVVLGTLKKQGHSRIDGDLKFPKFPDEVSGQTKLARLLRSG
jgi:hypothetical protein